MSIIVETIDKGKEFDFGKTSEEYALYRDIYPKSLYQKLIMFKVGIQGQKILDLGTGTGVIPRNMYFIKAQFTGIDISENQIMKAKELSKNKNIEYKVSSAEDTGFENNSFDIVTACQCFQYFKLDTFIPELIRILKPQGRFCRIFMNWLPCEDEVVSEMENLVLKYNPDWSGGGFRYYNYSFPSWAKEHFELETVHSYREDIHFTKDVWQGRILTCRGIGASLARERVDEFDKEYQRVLSKYESDELGIKHQIHIEIYKLKQAVYL